MLDKTQMNADPTPQQIQNAIDWNIRRRDGEKHNAIATNLPSMRTEYERNARRHQRNIDALNAQLGGSK